MKHHLLKLVALLALVGPVASSYSAIKYWDIDGATAGAGGASPAGTWNTTTANWSTSSAGTAAATTFASNDDAIFSAGTNATGPYFITIATGTTVSASSVTVEEGNAVTFGAGTIALTGTGGTGGKGIFNVASGAYANFAGAAAGFVGGSKGLNKTGAGTLNLGGTETYSGDTYIDAGIIHIASSGTQFPFGTNVSGTATGTTIHFANGALLTTSNAVSATLNANYTLSLDSGGGSFASASAQSLSFSGKITGSGKLFKTTGGTLALGGTPTSDFSGGIDISAGTLSYSDDSQLGGTTQPITFSASGTGPTLSYSGTGSLTLPSTRTISVATGNQANLQASSGTAVWTIAAKVTGNGNLRRNSTGTGTIILSNTANDYTGSTLIDAGTFKLGASGVIPDVSAVTITAGTFDLNGFSETIGALTITGGTISGTGTLTPSKVDAQAGTISSIIGGSTGLRKTTTGALVLSGVNTYTGDTTNSAGSISINGTSMLGSGTLRLAGGNMIQTANRALAALIPNSIIMSANTILQGGGNHLFRHGGSISTTGGTLTLTNTGSSGTTFDLLLSGGGYTFSSPILFSPASTNNVQLTFFNATTNGDNTFSGIISGTGSVRRSVTAGATGGNVTLTGANTFTAGTTLASGSLGIGGSSVGSPGSITSGPLGTGTVTASGGGLFASGGARTLFNDITFTSGLTINGSDDLTLSGALSLGSSARTLTINNTGETTISGAMSSSVAAASTALTKAGNGTLTIPTDNSAGIAGNVTVSAGTLKISNGSGLATGTGTLTVNATGTLAGTGIVGPVTLSGTISPGTSIGTITTGGQVWNAGATSKVEIIDVSSTAGTGWDFINMGANTLTINATEANPFKIDLTSLAGGAVPGPLDVFDNTATYSWVIAQADGGILNFSPDKFQVLTGNFGNSLGTGSFGVSTNGNNQIVVNFAVAPIIDGQPQSVTVTVGGSAVFSVTNSGSAPFAYQWRKNGTSVTGATTASLTFDPVAATDAGTYSVRIFNLGGFVTSTDAVLSIPPTISSSPSSSTNTIGSSITFSVAADGQAPLSYQWKKDNVNIPGANTTNYAIPNVAGTNAGSYSVTVTNAVGSIDSAAAVLSTPPDIITQPTNVTTAGNNAVLTVEATGSPSIQYHWRRLTLASTNEIVIDNVKYFAGTNGSIATLTITNLVNGDNGDYDVVVSNLFGTPTSSVAVVTFQSLPFILSGPDDVTVNAGDTAVFTVNAGGAALLSYQWSRIGSGAISSATNSMFSIAGVQQADAGNYFVTVSNNDGSTNSGTAALTVIDPPIIVSSPANTNIGVGSNAVFSVGYSGSSASAQWKKNGVNLTESGRLIGTLTTNLTIVGVTHADEATYSVILSNSAGVVSNAATLVAFDPPVFTVNPISRTRATGTNVIFTASATGSTPSYQWKKVVGGVTNDVVDDLRISGSLTTNLSISNVSATDDGDYFAVASNLAGTANSSFATLTVIDAPSIVTPPQDLTVTNNNPATFTVIANGGGTLTYQWKKNGINISGANASSYTIASAALSDAASYSVGVTNAAAGVVSSSATLTVMQAPSITVQPQDVLTNVGGSATFTVTATGYPLNYQWYKNGSAISGATTNSYTDASVQTTDIGLYYVVVSNVLGSETSSSATLALSGAVYYENFDANHTASWNVNLAPNGSNAANIFFDYSTIGIPSAPNSVGGSTRGAKLEANFGSTPSVTCGVSISPLGQSFTGDFTLKYDLWQNFNGPLAAGGNGSTQITGGGILTSGTAAQGISSTIASIFFNTTGDAGSGIDYRAYTSAGIAASGSGVYSAPNSDQRSATNSYYSGFGNKTAPAAQLSLFSQQTGSTVSGAQGFAWHQVEIRKSGSTVTWKIDGLLIATVSTNSLTLGGNNILLNQWDINTTVSTDVNKRSLAFGLFDNVRVETNAAIPPTITSQPQNATVNAGGTTNFSVTASSLTTLRYQWQKDGVAISGATSSTLTLTNALASSSGTYRALVLNDSSIVTSQTATLTVIDPIIGTQPVSRSTNAGSSVTFSVTPTGTGPFTYLWKKDGNNASGVNITGQTSATLTVSSLLNADEGGYSAIVTGSAGSVTSSVATLTVQDPFVVTSPASQSKVTGSTVVFHVAAAGTSPTYQWRKGGNNISDDARTSGTTTSSLTIANLSSGDADTYSVAVTGVDGTVVSANATLTMIQAVAIVTPPSSQTNNAGTTATFTVAASGGGTLAYQWKRAGTNLFDNTQFAGVNTSTLMVSNVLAADATNYFVVVTNEDSSATCSDAFLTVIDPYITANPTNMTKGAGSNAVFSVSAVGTDLTYQWLKEGVELTASPGHLLGTQSANLTILSATDADEGNYSVIVSNSLSNTSTSSVAVLTVVNPPIVSISLTTQNVNQGQTAVFTAAFAGDTATYSWTKDGNPISDGSKYTGTATSSLMISGATQAEAGTYAVTASNFANSATSSAALTVTDPPTVATPLVSITKNAGEAVVFTVSAGGSSGVYSWSKNGGPALVDGGNISGATTSSLTISNLLGADQGVYTVTISNAAGTTNSSATLTVIDPIITLNPVNTSVNIGASTNLTVAAAGSPTLKYQWYFKGGPLKTGTNATLSITGATVAMSGSYYAVATNAYGKATSAVVTLTVVTPPLFNSVAAPITIKPKPSVPTGTRVTMFTVVKGTAPSYQWYFEGSPIPGATTATNIISAASTAHAGAYSVSASNSAGMITSSTSNLTVTLDTAVPVAAIKVPVDKSITFSSTNPTGTLIAWGTAADTAQLTNVYYRLNGGAWTPVTTLVPKDANWLAANWTNQITAVVGTNVLEAYTVDWTGLTSKVAKATFFFHIDSTLNVSIAEHDTREGEGSDSLWPPDYRGTKPGAGMVALPNIVPTNGATLYVNRGLYTLTAYAGHNQIFTNWASWITGGNTTNYIGTPKLDFIMKTYLNLQANFIHNPWMEAQGMYFGLATNGAVDYDISGGINFKVKTNLEFSGAVFVDGDKVAIAGKFDTDGTKTVTLSRAKLGKPNLILSITNLFGTAGSSGTNQIVGTLTDTNSGKVASVLSDQWIYNGATANPAQGLYTMVLDKSDSASSPNGYGYASINVDAMSKTIAVGGFADNTALAAQLGYVSKDGRWPMFNQIYPSKLRVLNYTNVNQFHTNATAMGMYLGWINLTNPATQTLRWTKKMPGYLTNFVVAPVGTYGTFYTNGFVLDVPTTVHSYNTNAGALSRELELTNILVSFADGNLVAPSLTHAARYETNNKVLLLTTSNLVAKASTNTALAKLSVAVDWKTGKVSGSFTNPISLLPIKFFGVALQPDAAYGYFLGTNEAGSFNLQADPSNP